MGCYRKCEQTAQTGDKKTMDLLASFYLFFELGEDFNLALAFGFENRHNRNILG